MNNVTLFIPNKQALDEIFTKDPPESNGLDTEKLYYIVSFVFNHLMKFYDSDYLDDEFSVTICSEHMKSILGRYPKEHIDYLVKHDILILVHKQLAGVTCRKYVLNASLLVNPSYYTVTGHTFKRSLKRNWKEKEKTKGGYAYLEKWLQKIEFNVEAATVFNNLMFECRKNHAPFLSKSRKRPNRFSNPYHQYVHGQLSIEKIQCRIIPDIDTKGMRLHSPLTNCQKMLRNYVTIDGKHLVSIDLKNSQPYMLLGLFNLINQQTPTIHQLHLPKSNLNFKFIHSIILRHSSNILYSKEFQEYKKMVTEGTIYDEFVKLYKFPENESDSNINARDLIKQHFMRCFYSKNGGYSAGMKSIFKTKFPKIYALMCDLKKEDHTMLAILLQRIESTIVLDKICGRISKENPNIPLLTIHDCILTTPDNVEYVAKIIEEECCNYIGIAPKLSFEFCNPYLNNDLLLAMDRTAEVHFKSIENE